jgi:hypothetical protein
VSRFCSQFCYTCSHHESKTIAWEAAAANVPAFVLAQTVGAMLPFLVDKALRSSAGT